jgi:hypothetical protein
VIWLKICQIIRFFCRKKVIVAGGSLIKIAFLGCQKVNWAQCAVKISTSWTWAVIFSMASGDVQRNRIIKSEQGVSNFSFCRNVLFLFSFRFFSFLSYFVSFRFRFRGISFRFVSFQELEIYFPFRFVSFQKIMRFLRFVPFRFVSFLNPGNFNVICSVHTFFSHFFETFTSIIEVSRLWSLRWHSKNTLYWKFTFHNCKQLLFYEFLKFGGEISAPGAWKSKISKKDGFFSRFFETKYCFF